MGSNIVDFVMNITTAKRVLTVFAFFDNFQVVSPDFLISPVTVMSKGFIKLILDKQRIKMFAAFPASPPLMKICDNTVFTFRQY